MKVSNPYYLFQPYLELEAGHTNDSNMLLRSSNRSISLNSAKYMAENHSEERGKQGLLCIKQISRVDKLAGNSYQYFLEY